VRVCVCARACMCVWVRACVCVRMCMSERVTRTGPGRLHSAPASRANLRRAARQRIAPLKAEDAPVPTEPPML